MVWSAVCCQRSAGAVPELRGRRQRNTVAPQCSGRAFLSAPPCNTLGLFTVTIIPPYSSPASCSALVHTFMLVCSASAPTPPPRFPGDDIPIIRGSALCALKGEKPELGRNAILKLMAVGGGGSAGGLDC